MNSSIQVLAILQARMSSSRLPGKVLKMVQGKPILALEIERIRKAKRIDKVIVATSEELSDTPIAELCESIGVDCYRGSLDNVLERFYCAAKPWEPYHVVRLTGDCPLLSPTIIDQVIIQHLHSGAVYTSNCYPPSLPDGLDMEIFTWSALQQAQLEATSTFDREHVTPYIRNVLAGDFKKHSYVHPVDLSAWRFTVDYPEDFELVRKIFDELYPGNPDFELQDIVDLLQQYPQWLQLNHNRTRNETCLEETGTLLQDTPMDDLTQRYRESTAALATALQLIPTGAQTFSKSRYALPEKVSPLYLDRGQGSQVWDIDGNQYTDFVSGLLAVSLGYRDPDVDAAVLSQLNKGVSFSLSTLLEQELAAMMIELIPCAEQVRFAKNGSDATSASIRLARAYTGREHVATCGYHGWQDWYIGNTTRSLGVPECVKQLTHSFDYNSLSSLEKLLTEFPNQFAAVIMEPITFTEPTPEFLPGVKALCQKHGVVLIFDEMITGFRFHLGGAQTLFGVTPDLATFGKGMANGFPLSAVVGRKDIMGLMEEIFFSGTFGGEALSIAAAKATVIKLKKEKVCDLNLQKGIQIKSRVTQLINDLGVGDLFAIQGHPVWTLINVMPHVSKDKASGKVNYSALQLKSLFLQECLRSGILLTGTHNLSYAHTDQDLEHLFKVYKQAMSLVKQVCEEGNIETYFKGEYLKPIFKVRN